MKRSASLDFLRGAAAFSVAIPHYLTANAPFQPFAEAFAIAGVEVFFVLSGFVLAPQIVDWVVGKPWRNLGVFLVRRWMRTIPPYVVALIVIATLTGNLMTADFARYLFYVENLFASANHVDFYPVAWSLAVEEWFYLLFAPALFLVARLLGRSDRRLEAALRDPGHSRRRGAAVPGCAARLGFERPPGDAVPHRLDRLGLSALSRARAPCAACAQLRLGPMAPRRACSRCLRPRSRPNSRLRSWRSAATRSAQRAFPYVSAAFGMILVGASWRAEGLFRARFVRGASFYLGRISYSVYLFHLVIIIALKPMLASAPLALQLIIYVAAILALSTVFFAGFERPILAARPYYGAARAAATVAAPQRRSSALGSFASRDRAWPCGARRRRARAQRLHGRQALCVLSAPRRDGGSRPCARPERAPASRAARSLWRRAPSFCSRSRCPSRTPSTAARPDCRWWRRSRRRPIPIAPLTPIRPRSQPGGSIISTNGSGRTE